MPPKYILPLVAITLALIALTSTKARADDEAFDLVAMACDGCSAYVLDTGLTLDDCANAILNVTGATRIECGPYVVTVQ